MTFKPLFHKQFSVLFIFLISLLFTACDDHQEDIVDTNKPTITIIGESPLRLTTDDTYEEKGALAEDDVGGQLEVKLGGSVNVQVPGEYEITYTAVDNWGNEVTAVRTVIVEQADHTKPVITINGDTDVVVEVNTTYEDQGATAIDAIDHDVEVKTTNTVDSNIVGSYTVTYSATDAAGNEATAVRNVTVKVFDRSKPVITLKGESPATIILGAVYTDAGATVSDDTDETIDLVTVNNVDANTVGSYTVEYSATDTAGNTATAVRNVNVKKPDTTKPVITVKGSNPVQIVQASVYEDAGATVADNEDDNIKIVVDNEVNVQTPGLYSVTYSATDRSGNTATATRSVQVIRPATFSVYNGEWLGKCRTSSLPTAVAVRHRKSINNSKLIDTITAFNTADCSGKSTSAIQVFADITYLGGHTTGICAGENIDLDITFVTRDGSEFRNITTFAHDYNYPVHDIICLDNFVLHLGKISNANDGSTPENRPVEFDFSNTGGLVAFNQTAPVITITGDVNIVVEQGSTYVDEGATATDDVDGDLGVTTTGSVDTSTPGVYIITYSATDSSLNTTTAIRNVTVKEAQTETSYTGTWKSRCEANTNPFLKSRGVIATSSSLFVTENRITTEVIGYNNTNCLGGAIHTGIAIANYTLGDELVAQPGNFCANGNANKVDMVVTAVALNGKVLSDKELLTFLAVTKSPTYNLVCIDPAGKLRSGDTSNGFDGTTPALRPILMNMTGAGYSHTH